MLFWGVVGVSCNVLVIACSKNIFFPDNKRKPLKKKKKKKTEYGVFCKIGKKI